MLMTWIVLGAVLLFLGFVGCVIPVIPGPILGYCGVLALVPTEKCPSTMELVVLGGLVVVVTVTFHWQNFDLLVLKSHPIAPIDGRKCGVI